MQYKYLKQPNFRNPQAPWQSRPFIPVRLFYKSEHVDAFALVDSGADECLFNASLGEALGIDVLLGTEGMFYGIEGGGKKAYFHTIKLGVGGHEIKLRAGFIESESVGGILGQNSFFKSFEVKFRKDKEVVYIKPLNA